MGKLDKQKAYLTMAIVAAVMTSLPSKAQERTFGGYECTEDCSGHQAGYEWAEEHNITDERIAAGTRKASSRDVKPTLKTQAEVRSRMTTGTK